MKTTIGYNSAVAEFGNRKFSGYFTCFCLMTAEIGDDAELLVRLGPKGKFEGGYSDLTSWADDMSPTEGYLVTLSLL